jgi:allantoate deiminase
MQSAERLLARCKQLAEISALSTGILRAYLTPEHQRANQLVSEWMQAEGMRSWVDEAGNVWGRYQSINNSAKRLIIGSHLDTVPNAGQYDGILGVLSGIELINNLQAQAVQLPFHLDVVGFADEEGYRFGKTLLGSEAIAGGWDEDWAHLRDAKGISMAAAFELFGLDVNKTPNAVLNADELIGYWELHIEQGPILEAEDLAVGIVTGIAGARRFNLTVIGRAGHAGTVPMNLRQDATVGAAEMVQVIEHLAIANQLVATVGKFSVKPGGVNVIAGEANFSLDIRSEDDQLRDAVVDKIKTALNSIAMKRGLKLLIEQTHSANAVLCDHEFMQILGSACQKVTGSNFQLISGAGHDAMAVATLCKVAMLFMRCDKGISHHPDESVTVQDTAIALQVLTQAVLDLAASYKFEMD